MQRICLIEDSVDIQRLFQQVLRDQYHVHCVSSLQDAAVCLEREVFDMVVLDVNLPDGNGFEFCARIKAGTTSQSIPVIFLTAKDEPCDQMLGFTVGADDYIVKPFQPLELQARIRARMRKHAPEAGESSLRVGPFRFDRVRQRLFRSDSQGREHDINLTPFEFRLVYFLALNQDRYFPRAELLGNIRDPNVHVSEDNIYTHVSAIRRKLGSSAGCLESLPRVGYRFVPSAPQADA